MGTDISPLYYIGTGGAIAFDVTNFSLGSPSIIKKTWTVLQRDDIGKYFYWLSGPLLCQGLQGKGYAEQFIWY